MSIFSGERSQAVTPIMLAFSVSLHLLLVILLLKWSLPSMDKSTRPKPGVTQVSLIEAPDAKPNLEMISRGPVRAHKVDELVPLLQQELPPSPSDIERKAVSYEPTPPKDAPVVPLKKRKGTPKRIETAREDTPKKRESKPHEKKEDPNDFLEKRLSQIRAEVQNKRKEGGSHKDASPPIGLKGGASASSVGSEDFVRWFEDVRGRINSHWSILADNRKMQRFAVIGVRLTDDGRLIDATVDETSGDPLFDKSAMRAVFLASPFPPVPQEIREKIKQAGGLALRFSPGGIQ